MQPSHVPSQPVTQSIPKPQSRRCEPLLRVLRPGTGKFVCLSKGSAGSYETAAAMANLVREDTVKDAALEDWAKQILIDAGLDSYSDSEEVAGALFRYVQQFTYVHDPAGEFDAIRSARETIAKGYGDCDDLSVLLATLLSLVGFKPRFVLARYKDTGTSAGFDHIYVDLDLPRGRFVLDPSTRRNGPGWEAANAKERVAYPIFGGAPIGLGTLLRAGARTAGRVAGFGGLGDYCCEDQACAGAQQNSTADGAIRVVALAASPVVTLPVVLLILGGCCAAMKLASRL